jgi:mRNA-degrading endonuclease YafQ of YafQ-DinJ toxin-antitoxin module
LLREGEENNMTKFVEEIRKIIREFNALRDSMKEKTASIMSDERYSDDFKRSLIAQEKQNCKAIQDALISKAKKITEDAKNEQLKGKTVGTRDQAFDIKLSNALQLLKTIGDSMTPEELTELVEPFRQDYHTMNLLRRVFVKGNIQGVTEIFGIDRIDHNVSAMDEIMKHLSQEFNRDIEQADTMRLLITLEIMKE